MLNRRILGIFTVVQMTGLSLFATSAQAQSPPATQDDDLEQFETHGGASPLPDTSEQGYVEHDGARIWYAAYGSGPPVILLHGGLGNSRVWGYQVPMLINSGHRVILIDSRGHGRSTRDLKRFTYELMASDVLAVMDTLHIKRAAAVGWSDGAVIALVLAIKAPQRVAGVFFFGCNMDPSGTKEVVEPSPAMKRAGAQNAKDYAELSDTPAQFEAFSEEIFQMWKTEPNYSADELAAIHTPVVIVHSEHDEFIKLEHAEYLARTIPEAELVLLPGVGHFAPLQRPEEFNSLLQVSLSKVLP